MKCEKCGFIYNGITKVCPYCGSEIFEKKKNFFLKKISLGNNVKLSLKTLIYIILINIFIIGVIVDLITNWQYKLTFYLFISTFMVITIISIAVNHSELISIFERIDFYLIASTAMSFFFFYNQIYYSLDLFIPIYLMFYALISIVLLIISKQHIRPIKYFFTGFFHWLIILTIFIMILIPDLSFMVIPDASLNDAGRVIVYVCFGVLSLYLIDIILFFILRIIGQAKQKYGGN